MNEVLPVWIMEPSAKEKRRQFSRTLIGETDVEPDLEAVKSSLKTLRQRSLEEHQSLLEEFKRSVEGYPAVKVVSARDAGEAADYIEEIASGTRYAVVNRSSIVMNELRPALEKRGFRVVEPYVSESDTFENRIRDYWDLPSLVEKGLAGSFEVSHSSEDLCLPPRRGDKVKDCVAVLGVNAASAEDGSVFFLQHFSNISKSMEQAAKVVLVVGLDKLTRDREDAAFQTRCMGMFGMEGMLLNLRSREAGPGEIDSLPDSSPAQGREVHILLLDNGRSRLLSTDMQELLLCIGCKACIKQCPINHAMSRDGAVWSPRDYLFMFLLEQNPSMDTCLHCGACRGECPLDIDIPGLMWAAQADRAARHGRTLRERMLGNPELLARLGSLAAPVSNAVIDVDPGKTLIKMVLGLDRKRQVPRFHRKSFKRWFASRHDRNGATRPTKKVAYYVGCFANYYETEVAKALISVLEGSGFEVLVPDHKCCGMPMMAAKNVSGARKNAAYNLQSLAAVAASGYDIVTTCPSCTLMLKQEYLNLFESDEARLVAGRTRYVEEYFTFLNRLGVLNTDLREIPQSVFYHVPCHLKQGNMVNDSLQMLSLVPGLSIEKVNAACCGMAGYHGHKKIHSALSMEIGSKLFEEIALVQADRIVTGCAACKMQIEAGTGSRAIHPILLWQEACGLGPEML